MSQQFHECLLDLLKDKFPECEFVVYIHTDKDSRYITRGYHMVTRLTNTFEIRKFAKEYPYFDGIVGHPLHYCCKHDLKESIVVPDYIVLKKEYNDKIDDLVTLLKLQGYLY
jgi:hypothetical protein